MEIGIKLRGARTKAGFTQESVVEKNSSYTSDNLEKGKLDYLYAL